MLNELDLLTLLIVHKILNIFSYQNDATWCVNQCMYVSGYILLNFKVCKCTLTLCSTSCLVLWDHVFQDIVETILLLRYYLVYKRGVSIFFFFFFSYWRCNLVLMVGLFHEPNTSIYLESTTSSRLSSNCKTKIMHCILYW